jgi:hypothetical protein
VERAGRHEVKLGTPVGDVGWLPLGHGIIPVDED